MVLAEACHTICRRRAQHVSGASGARNPLPGFVDFLRGRVSPSGGRGQKKRSFVSGRVAETTRERTILGVKIAVGKVSDETLLNASPLF